MKILCSLVLLITFNSFAGITVVSDLDDTLKITNAGHKVERLINGVFTAKVFTGIPILLREMRPYVNEVHVLSASPAVVGPRIRSLLGKHEIEFESYIMRRTFGRLDKFNYKINAIRALIEESTDDFILIGDDVDKDPEVYEVITKLFPHRVLASYIHLVRNRPVNSIMKTYLTSFDLALLEYQAGRMSEIGVKAIAKSQQEEELLTYTFPHFAHCPEDDRQWQWQYQTLFASEAYALARKLMAFCRSGLHQK